MTMRLLKEVPRYECLLERARQYPELDPSATEAFLHLLRTSTDLLEAFGTVHAGHHISRGRFVVLMLLGHCSEKPVNLADLADRAHVTRATMTGLIDTLVRDGHVKREQAADDRRMMLVTLTAAGKAFLDEILPDYFRRIAVAMGGLTEPERKSLVALMGKIEQTVPSVRMPTQNPVTDD
jgi:DNA-binding MarR family transcriptional regulator